MKHNVENTVIRVLPIILVMLAITNSALRAENPALSYVREVGSVHADMGYAVAVDGDQNTYVTGRFTGNVDFDPGSGTHYLTSDTSSGAIFVASYDLFGTLRWAFGIGDGSGDDYGTSIAVDLLTNDVVVTGKFTGTLDFDPGSGTANLSSTGWSTFVARYNSNGAYGWAFKIGPYTGTDPSVAVDPYGAIIVAGSFKGIVDFDPGSGTANLASAKESKKGNAPYTADAYVAKYSNQGAYEWAFKVAASTLGVRYDEEAYDVDVDGNSNIYVTGKLDVGTSITVDFDPSKNKANLTGPGLFVAKYTDDGAFVWVRQISGSSGNFSVGHEMDVDYSGNISLAGEFKGTIDFDPGSGTANLVGSTGGPHSVYIARFNSSGIYQWAFTPALAGSASAVHNGSNGHVYVAGTFIGANDFDPGSDTVELDTSSIGQGGYIASYSSTGSYRWAFPLIDSGIAACNDIVLNGGLWTTGVLSVRVDFDPSSDTETLTSAGDKDIFLALYYEPSGLLHDLGPVAGLDDVGGQPLAIVGPNPFTSDLTIRLPDASMPTTIELVDLTGQIVEAHNISGVSELVVGKDLFDGTYVVRIQHGASKQQLLVQKTR